MITAETRAREDEGDSNNTFKWDNQPAEWVFVGIRKLIAVAHQFEETSPNSGDELTYSEFEAQSIDSVHDFAQGNPVKLYLTN